MKIQARLMLMLLLALALLWLIGLIVLPHVELGILSLRAREVPRVYESSLAQFAAFFEESLYRHTFVRTAQMSILAITITLLMAFPMAWTIARIARVRVKSMLFIVCLIPFWVNETVRTLGWMILRRESGVLPAFLVWLGLSPAPVEMLYHDATIIVGLVYTLMMCMAIPLTSALENLDDALVEAAYDLGGNGWSILRQIVMPHATRRTRHRGRLHCGVHADLGQQPDTHAVGWQKLAVARFRRTAHRDDVRLHA